MRLTLMQRGALQSGTATPTLQHDATLFIDELEARLRELEGDVERQRVTIQAECKASSEHFERAIAAESECAALRERVAKALRELTSPPMYSAKQRCAEALRGS